jgi:histidine triad (HIT) family protein
MSDDCLFCQIAAGEVPSEAVASTEEVYAFRDISPKAPTHVLVIPRRHIPHAHEISEGDGPELEAMVRCAQDIAETEGVAESGYRLVLNVGDDAGNTVPHLHLHVIGGRQLSWPPG